MLSLAAFVAKKATVTPTSPMETKLRAGAKGRSHVAQRWLSLVAVGTGGLGIGQLTKSNDVSPIEEKQYTP